MSAAVKQPDLKVRTRFDQLAWYYHRLRAMDGAEAAHRVGEAVKRRLSRFSRSGWASFDMGDGELPCLTPRAGMIDRLAPALAAQWREVAVAALRGDVELLGKSWPAGRGAGRWHRDPVTGGTWPAGAYCFDIPYRREPSLGDVKYVWELNRLQFLQPVAALAAYEKDDALAAFCVAEIEGWMDANPPFYGVNWASGIELALRIVSLLVVVGLLGVERVPPGQRRKIRTCLNAHAYWLARYPSRHSSANNHLIAEAGALFVLGTLWPELGLGAGVAEAREVLIAEASRQFHEDGVGAEQSPSYTAFTLEWYLLSVDVAARAGDPFPECVTERLGKAGQFLRWITDEGGNVPRIGDDDEGQVIAGAPDAGGYVTSVLGCIAASLAQPDLAPPRVRASLRNLYLGLPSPCLFGPNGAKSFADGGYSVFRRSIAGRKAMLVMDHGPLGHLSIAAHGHADALALWLHLDDQPVLVDAGTYLYHSGGPWRDHFRGTPSHNTLCLDGQSSSRIAGPFNWSRKAQCERIAWKASPDETSVFGRHDGYLTSHGLLHERLLVAHGRGFTVRDTLAGEGAADRSPDIKIGFLIHPALSVAIEGATATIARDGEALLRISGRGAPAFGLLEIEEARCWYSDRFGSKRPATQLAFKPQDASCRRFEVELEIIPASMTRGESGRKLETLATVE